MAQTAAPAAPAAPAAAPAASAAPAYTFALKGFVSMSAAYQTGAFFLSEGQQSLSAAQPTQNPLVDDSSLTFDVRQSRFNFSVKGPPVMFGATPSAVLEIDFFQGFGGGNFGSASLLNRLRLVYSELNWGNHRLQFGQQNDLIFAMAPTSLSHIGFPLAYFTGNLGWRRPGIFGYHTLPLSADMKIEAAWEIARSQWADASSGGAAGVTIGGAAPNQANAIGLGEASAAPAVEGRVTFMYGKMLSAFVAGHWNQVDLTGVGTSTTGVVNTIAVTSYHAGAKLAFDLKPLTLTLQGSGFVGQNVSPLIGDFITFRLGSPQNPDVNVIGWWGQLGVGYDKWSVWGFYGNQKPDETDMGRASAANGRIENTTTNVILMYRDGGYGISAEWINFKTKYALTFNGTGDARRIATTQEAKADQFILTANYFF
jgi:hypothetical protein